MPKDITDLPKDVYEVLTSDEDNTLPIETLVDYGHNVSHALQNELRGKRRARSERVLYASEIGKKCSRQVAYSMDDTYEAEPLAGNTKIKFQYGHMLEEMILALVMAAGHDVKAQQKVYEQVCAHGWKVRGRCDAIIDGHMTDEKSSSTFMFNRFMKDGINDANDGFGYRAQVVWYAEMELREEKPMTTNDRHPCLVLLDKQNGTLGVVSAVEHGTLPVFKMIEKRIEELEHYLQTGELPKRMDGYEVPEGASGNMKLCTTCSYCNYKDECHPKLRTFNYAKGPVFLTKVVKEPNVHEIKK